MMIKDISREQKGFTLLEVLLAVMILGDISYHDTSSISDRTSRRQHITGKNHSCYLRKRKT